MMTDRELDAAIAEKVMGFVTAVKILNGRYGSTIDGYIAHFSTDRNAAALVLEEIGKRGLQREFNEQLARQIWPEDRPMCTFGGADQFAFEKQCATPRQLMEAALAAVASSKEPDADTVPLQGGRE